MCLVGLKNIVESVGLNYLVLQSRGSNFRFLDLEG